ncbi:TPA: hypothetical protein ACGSTL_001380 [Vibrio parahaemolyticus]|uniref:hypothetical protein n=1 Tax=Vibrio campbellii TaxID=680 RepID=UPI001F081F11|nr:hypothetical protein [Vibrio campbellii]UMM06825.1 hypothetical protein MKR81_26555 [Vibrio campbellii]
MIGKFLKSAFIAVTCFASASALAVVSNLPQHGFLGSSKSDNSFLHPINGPTVADGFIKIHKDSWTHYGTGIKFGLGWIGICPKGYDARVESGCRGGWKDYVNPMRPADFLQTLGDGKPIQYLGMAVNYEGTLLLFYKLPDSMLTEPFTFKGK